MEKWLVTSTSDTYVCPCVIMSASIPIVYFLFGDLVMKKITEFPFLLDDRRDQQPLTNVLKHLDADTVTLKDLCFAETHHFTNCAIMSEVEKRIFVGGLCGGVSQEELKEKFSRFGQVSNIEIKTRQSEIGFSAYNNTNWKGGQLRLQYAKESFLAKLEQERRADQAGKPKRTAHEDTPKVTFEFNVQDTKAVPGTPIEGKKDWVMGKYSRPLPVLHIKKPHSKKVVTLDPSKTTHALKKIKTDDFDTNRNTDLTWQMEVKDTEITKKRMGQFPLWQPSKKASGDISGRLHQLAAETNASDEELEVVSTARTPSVQAHHQRDYDSDGSDSDGSDSAGSADTDEIIAQSSKKKSLKPSKVTSADDTSKQNGTSPASEKRKRNQKEIVTSSGDGGAQSNAGKRLITAQPTLPSAVPKPKFVKVEKPAARASRQVQQTVPVVRSVAASGSSSDSDDASEDSMGNNSARQPLAHKVPVFDELDMSSDSNDSDDASQAKKSKKGKNKGKPTPQKIPEFRGLSMLSDYSDEEAEMGESETKSRNSFERTHMAGARSSLSQHSDNSVSSDTGSGSEDSGDSTTNSGQTLSQSKPSAVSKETNSSKLGEVVHLSPRKHLPAAGSGDGSEDTDDILSASADKRKLVTQPKASALREGRTAAVTKGAVTLDEFDSGLADHTRTRTRKSMHMESDDSDFDSNDFELVAKKLAASLQNKGDSKSSKPQQTGRKDGHINQSRPHVVGDAPKQVNSSPTVQSADVSNQRRLQAIAEKNAEQRRQQALIKKALEGGQQGNKLHKFFSDSESDIEDVPGSQSSKQHQQQQPQLFSGSGQESSEEEDVDETFRLRPQFEGEKGKKLMALQSRFGRDMRFRMDERFQESGSEVEEEEEKEEEETAADEEKSRSLKILETVLGHKVKVPSHKDRVFKDMNKLRYIPGSEEEENTSGSDEEEKPSSEQQSDQPKDKANRYYEVSSNLKDLFSGSAKPFSFFGAASNEATEGAEQNMATDLAHYSDSSSEQEFSGMTTEENEPGPRRVKRWQDDTRLAAAVKYFKRSEDWEEVVEQWSARRSHLMELVKLRHKRYQRKMKERERGVKKKWLKF
ncbi:hypothetical protein BaRGS_00009222 [Batillaria attramentaria]|uniref:RRM domain-containing protein n=1 Tax=Batillaria attramentaria TaxID=370345 RepID=A0ABD0LJD4_9CAEN